MEVVEHKIIYSSRSSVFDIHPFGDQHLGSIHSAENEIEKEVDRIRHKSNARWIGMGDYADCIIKDDPRFDIGGLASWVKPDNITRCQSDRLKELFKPIASKSLGLITGNHEELIHLRYQEDFTRNLCEDLGIPYLGYSCFCNLHFARRQEDADYRGTINVVKIHAWHGSGAAQTEGARLMRLMRLVNEFEAHIYLMGHLHAMTQHTPDRISCNAGRLKSIRLAATITGSWLTTYTQPRKDIPVNPSYAEMRGYKPSRIGSPIVHIKPDKEEFTIEG